MSALLKQILADNPAVYWPFDETSDGATCLDRSGNGRIGTKFGTGASLGSTTVVPGTPNSEKNTGTGHWNLTNVAALDVGTGDFTFECWMICTNDTSNYVQVFGRDSGSSGNGMILYLETATGIPRIYTGGAANSFGPTRLSDSKLHHVIYRRISGVQVGSAPAPGSTNGVARDLRVGTLDGTFLFFLGNMAHFAYYTAGLSDARVKAHYEAGLRERVVY